MESTREKTTAEQQTNCKNCGAPLDKFGNCEYCGTVKKGKSEIIMTADSIRITYS